MFAFQGRLRSGQAKTVETLKNDDDDDDDYWCLMLGA